MEIQNCNRCGDKQYYVPGTYYIPYMQAIQPTGVRILFSCSAFYRGFSRPRLPPLSTGVNRHSQDKIKMCHPPILLDPASFGSGNVANRSSWVSIPPEFVLPYILNNEDDRCITGRSLMLQRTTSRSSFRESITPSEYVNQKWR